MKKCCQLNLNTIQSVGTPFLDYLCLKETMLVHVINLYIVLVLFISDIKPFGSLPEIFHV